MKMDRNKEMRSGWTRLSTTFFGPFEIRKALAMYWPLFLAGMAAGLRPSELFSLRWCDVHSHSTVDCKTGSRFIGPQKAVHAQGDRARNRLEP